MGKNRLEAFSDGVIAIIITIRAVVLAARGQREKFYCYFFRGKDDEN